MKDNEKDLSDLNEEVAQAESALWEAMAENGPVHPEVSALIEKIHALRKVRRLLISERVVAPTRLVP